MSQFERPDDAARVAFSDSGLRSTIGPCRTLGSIPGMESDVLRLLMRAKLADGRLPHDSIPRIWGGPGFGEMCDACEGTIRKPQMVMEGISEVGRGIQMHVECFYMWDQERKALGHEPSESSGPGPA